MNDCVFCKIELIAKKNIDHNAKKIFLLTILYLECNDSVSSNKQPKSTARIMLQTSHAVLRVILRVPRAE